MEAAPKHLIIVDGAIMQPVPEHPKRDYIFCLSTAFGDAYLFQVKFYLVFIKEFFIYTQKRIYRGGSIKWYGSVFIQVLLH